MKRPKKPALILASVVTMVVVRVELRDAGTVSGRALTQAGRHREGSARMPSARGPDAQGVMSVYGSVQETPEAERGYF